MRNLFRRQKKVEVLSPDGISILGSDSYPSAPKNYIFFSRALIAFLLSYGMIGCVKSSFAFPGNSIVIALITVLSSVLVSFLYYNKLTKNLGYIILFFCFLWLVSIFRYYANSGFSAMTNILYTVMDKQLDLPAVKQFAERYTNQNLTITICLSLFGIVYSIFLNMILAAKSKPLFPFLLTSFPIFVGLYFDKMPDYLSSLLYMSGMLSLILLYEAQTVKNLKAGKQQLRVIGNVLLILGVLMLVIMLIVPSSSLHTPTRWNRLRTKTNGYVRNIAINGLSSFWNPDNVGGLMSGVIGDVGTVSPDFQTDLTLRLAPYTYDRIYLRNMVGVYYHMNNWIDSATRNNPDETFPSNYLNYEVQNLVNGATTATDSYIQAKVKVTKKDAISGGLLPYYTMIPTTSSYTRPLGLSIPLYNSKQVEEYSVYAVKSNESLLQNTLSLSLDEYHDRIENESHLELDWVNESFRDQMKLNLQIPDTLYKCINSFSQEAGINDNLSVHEIITKTTEYFQKAYLYSYNPGKTPRGKDTIQYFLTENKRGFCSHFASAAVMIFRDWGIPARYVQGYAVDYTLMLDGELVPNEDYKNWVQGDTSPGETAVIDVDVNDSVAHAWVEVYIPTLGWAPVDVTPYSTEEADTAPTSFWTAFSNWFEGNALNDAFSDTTEQPLLRTITIKRVKLVILVLVGGVVFILLLRILLIVIRRYRSTHSRSIRNNMTVYHSRLIQRLTKHQPKLTSCSTLNEQEVYLINAYPQAKELLEHYFALLDQCWYQEFTVGLQTFQEWYATYRQLKNTLRR